VQPYWRQKAVGDSTAGVGLPGTLGLPTGVPGGVVGPGGVP
jgi:hypothetical protein